MDRVIRAFPNEEIGGGLRWCNVFGLAFQADMRGSVDYGDDYWQTFAGYEGSATCAALNAARLALVRDLSGRVLDVGIGSGSFLTACQEAGVAVLGGCDVNPRGIEWLTQRGWLVDPQTAAETSAEPIIWTFWDSLEHVRAPHELLDLIRVGDFVCVTVPVFQSLRKTVFTSKHFKPDEHYYYFTPAGLIRWLSCYGLQLVAANRDEEAAGRESVASFVFHKIGPPSDEIIRRAFIVCGAESSGNRLLGAILTRAGCWGEGSTNQPEPCDVPDDQSAVMVIRHHDLRQTWQTLTSKGFRVTALLPVREWNANLGSLVTRGHDLNQEAAELRIKRTLFGNLSDSLIYNIPLIVTTYESLQDAASVTALLGTLGLPADNLDRPLELRGQERPDQTFFPEPLRANAKHYVTDFPVEL